MKKKLWKLKPVMVMEMVLGVASRSEIEDRTSEVSVSLLDTSSWSGMFIAEF